MRRLIVNADDLGLSLAANSGIFAAHAHGIVTAATVVANGTAVVDAAERASAHPGLDLGLHLNFTEGTPLALDPTTRWLRQGRLPGPARLALAALSGRIAESELLAEGRAQVETFLARFGPPSHLDLHQHTHLLGVVRRTAIALVREFRVPWIRWPVEVPARGWKARLLARALSDEFPADLRRTDHFVGLHRTGRWTKPLLLETLQALRPGLTELMMHPGDDGDPAAHRDRLTDSRPIERDLLCDPDVRAAVERGGIALTSFAEAAQRPEALL